MPNSTVGPKYRGVQGGTPAGEPLCRTCRLAHIVQGLSLSDTELWCNAVSPSRRRYTEAHECASYDDKRLPQMYMLEQLAWIFKTDVKTKQIGFVPPSKYPTPAVTSE